MKSKSISGAVMRVCGAPLRVCGAPLRVCGAPLRVCGAPLRVCGAVMQVCGASNSIWGALTWCLWRSQTPFEKSPRQGAFSFISVHTVPNLNQNLNQEPYSGTLTKNLNQEP